jgi:thiol-disulfide isomerase/thioredoxin
MSYLSFQDFSNLSFQNPETELYPTTSMKGIRSSSKSQPSRFELIDPNEIEQEARDDQDQRNKEVLMARKTEGYSAMEEHKKIMEEHKTMMAEQKKLLEEQRLAMTEQQKLLAERERNLADMVARATARPPPPPPAMGTHQTGQPGFSDLSTLMISLDGKTPDQVKAQIKGDAAEKKTSFVWFYAPWCGYCTRIIGMMGDVAAQMKGKNINMYMVNMDNRPEMGEAFNVRGFPTLNVYHGEPGVPTTYNGDRSANDLISFLTAEIAKA